MPRAEHDLPQAGNPHGLTVNQHVFPAASIARFCNADGVTDVLRYSPRKRFLAKPSNRLFCAVRAWDHGAEHDFKKIEDRFQEIVDRIRAVGTWLLSPADHDAISDFMALWLARSTCRKLKVQGYRLNGIVGLHRHFTKDEQEQLEKARITPIRPDGSIAARHINANTIWLRLGEFKRYYLRNAKWGLGFGQGAQFCVPEIPADVIIPIGPQQALFARKADCMLLPSEIARTNLSILASDSTYVFANDLERCAGLEDILWR